DGSGIATALMAGGQAAADPREVAAGSPQGATVSLSNSDIQVVSSTPLVLAGPAQTTTPTPQPAQGHGAGAAEAQVAPVPADTSLAAEPTRSPTATPSRARRSSSRAARIVPASMFLAVAGVVTWYATSDDVLQSADLALPAPAQPPDDSAHASPAPAPPVRGDH